MQKIKERILRIFDFYGLEEADISFEETEVEGKTTINILIPEEHAKHFIGVRGETLEALEIMVRLAHLDELGEDKRLQLDINGYRKEREQKLRDQAIEVAQEVIATQGEYVFNNLNSYERFLVHTAISESPDLQAVETFSEDDAYGRVLVVRLKAE